MSNPEVSGVDRTIALLRGKKPNGTMPHAEPEPFAPEPAPALSRHITEILSRRSQVEWLPGLDDILERRVVAVLAGPHGSYKSAFVGRLHVLAALAGTPGMMCYGEGAGLDRRLAAMLREYAPDAAPDSVPLYAIEKRVNLATPKGLEAIRNELRARKFSGGFISIDTYSKFAAGLDQNDNAAASEYIAGLDSLRVEFDSTVLLSTHTGHTEQKRARGASSLIDDTEAEYVASFANGVMKVTRERFKDSPSLPPLTFKPRAVELGYMDRRGAIVTGLVLDECNAERTHNEKPIRGANEERAMRVARTAPGPEIEIAWVVAEAVKEMPRGSAVQDKRAANVERAVCTLVNHGHLFMVPNSGESRVTLSRVREVPAVDWTGEPI